MVLSVEPLACERSELDGSPVLCVDGEHLPRLAPGAVRAGPLSRRLMRATAQLHAFREWRSELAAAATAVGALRRNGSRVHQSIFNTALATFLNC